MNPISQYPNIQTLIFQSPNNHKGVSLIIVIFAMMLLAVLGWSLAVLHSTDFEVSLRQADSERALYLAEAGAQWALIELKQEFSCRDFNRDNGLIHNLDFGQYRVKCSCDGSYSECRNEIQLTIESFGYVPSEGNSRRAQRNIELVVSQGAFATAASVKNLFDWSGIDRGRSKIEGDLRAGHFSGDGDSTYDEVCVDYGTEEYCGETLPPDGDGDERIQGATSIPAIDMEHFKQESQDWGNYVDYSATAEVSNGSSGQDLKLKGAGIFDSTIDDDEHEAVRLVGEDWSDSNWVVVKKYRTKSWVEVYLKDGMDMNDWVGKTVKVVKRFAEKHNNEDLWYIEGDILIDVRNKDEISQEEEDDKKKIKVDKDAHFEKTSLVAEGDIIIKGSKTLDIKAHAEPSTNETFPAFATQGGNIYSKDLPKDDDKGRKIDGLIYTYKEEDGIETGDVWFNCIKGRTIIANNLTLEGEVKLKYEPKYIDPEIFTGALSVINWQEK